jgi:hypothetical protein
MGISIMFFQFLLREGISHPRTRVGYIRGHCLVLSPVFSLSFSLHATLYSFARLWLAMDFFPPEMELY